MACLKQQDRSRGILAKAGRENSASGAAADDNHVGGLGQVRHTNLLVLRVVTWKSSQATPGAGRGLNGPGAFRSWVDRCAGGESMLMDCAIANAVG